MRIKAADDKRPLIAGLMAFLDRPDLTAATRHEARTELKRIQQGVQGEKAAAYRIDFLLGRPKRRNWVVLHDLRLEHEGRTAQIDHLFMNRFLELWVCESKNFSGDLEINPFAEFTVDYGDRRYAIRSPLAQNHEHATFLQRFFREGAVELPRRLGLRLMPTIKSLVLISDRTIIKRPRENVPGLETLMKAENFDSFLETEIAQMGNPAVAMKLVSAATLEKFASNLAAQHRPRKTRDWSKWFRVGPAASADRRSIKCAGRDCRHLLSPGEIAYCRRDSAAFEGMLLCWKCQPGIRHAAPKLSHV